MTGKINRIICFGLAFFSLIGCSDPSQSFSVESSVEKLQSNGWSLNEKPESVDLEQVTKYINAELEEKNVGFEVQTIRSYESLSGPGTLPPTDPNWTPPRFVQFITFSNEEDAEKYFDYFVERSTSEYYVTKGSYIALSDAIYVDTNSEGAKNLIPLEFKLV
jgi:hypothetical protein